MPSDIQELTLWSKDHLISVNPHDFIGRNIVINGDWNRKIVQEAIAFLFKRNKITKNSIALEIGGNIGTQTIYLLKEEVFSKVIVIEPDQDNYLLLTKNLAQNGLLEKVQSVRCAVGDKDGMSPLYKSTDNFGAHSLIKNINTTETVYVPVKRIDTILSDLEVDPNDIGFIWMDIEGFESEALQSMLAILANKTPMMMEWSPIFLGGEKTLQLREFLGKYYDRCWLWGNEKFTSCRVEKLPAQKQIDVLFVNN
ncbi:MAG: FkbM family methyltransferase [Nitrospinales bacterium]